MLCEFYPHLRKTQWGWPAQMFIQGLEKNAPYRDGLKVSVRKRKVFVRTLISHILHAILLNRAGFNKPCQLYSGGFKEFSRTSLVVQRLRLQASTARAWVWSWSWRLDPTCCVIRPKKQKRIFEGKFGLCWNFTYCADFKALPPHTLSSGKA